MHFHGIEKRVDWFLLIDHTRRIDYAVMYLCKHLIYIVYSYCLLFPSGIHKDTKVFIFILAICDLLHYFLTSHIEFALPKLVLCLGIFYVYKKISK